MKKRARCPMAVAHSKGEISLGRRVVRSKKAYTRKSKHKKSFL
jgi:hypothetical protein